MKLNNYYNTYKAHKNYEKALYIAGRGLQSAELNEVQEITLDKLKALGNTFYTKDQVLRGGELTVLNNVLYVAAATVYVKGSVRSVAAQTFSLDPNVDYELGVLYSETVITSEEDEDLLDPAVGTRNWNQPGAARLKVSVEWALKREGQQLAAGVEFLSYKKIKEGVVEEAPSTGSNSGITGGASGVGSSPDLSGMLADYDYERFGSYIQASRGFEM